MARPFTDYSWDLVKWPPDVSGWGRLVLFLSYWGPAIWGWLGFSLGRRRLFIGGVVGLFLFWGLCLLTGYEWARGTALARGEPGLGVGAYLLSQVPIIPRPSEVADLVLALSSGLLLRSTLSGWFEATRSDRLLPIVLSVACFGYVVFWSIDAQGARYLLEDLRGLTYPHNARLAGVAAVLWVALPMAAASLGYLGLRTNLRQIGCSLAVTYALLLTAFTGAGWFHTIFSTDYSRMFLCTLMQYSVASAIGCGLIAGPLAWKPATRGLT